MSICRKCELDAELADTHRKPEFCIDRLKREVKSLRAALKTAQEGESRVRAQLESVRAGKAARPR